LRWFSFCLLRKGDLRIISKGSISTLIFLEHPSFAVLWVGHFIKFFHRFSKISHHEQSHNHTMGDNNKDFSFPRSWAGTMVCFIEQTVCKHTHTIIHICSGFTGFKSKVKPAHKISFKEHLFAFFRMFLELLEISPFLFSQSWFSVEFRRSREMLADLFSSFLCSIEGWDVKYNFFIFSN